MLPGADREKSDLVSRQLNNRSLYLFQVAREVIQTCREWRVDLHLPGGWPLEVRRLHSPPCGEQALPKQTPIGRRPEAPGHQRSAACEILRRQKGYNTPQQLIRQSRKVAAAFIFALHALCSISCTGAFGGVRLLTARAAIACARRLQSHDLAPVDILELVILQLKRADAPGWTVVQDGRQLHTHGAMNFISRHRGKSTQAQNLKIKLCPTDLFSARCGHRLRAARAGMVIPVVSRHAIVKTLPQSVDSAVVCFLDVDDSACVEHNEGIRKACRVGGIAKRTAELSDT